MVVDRLKEHIEQICLNATRAIALIADMEEAAFLSDLRTQLAVGMTLVWIGEAADRIAIHHSEFPIDHPDIPWSKMRAMRDLILRDDYSLEPPVVLATVRMFLPELLSQLDSLRNWRAQGE
jgi:uncharacterized protein with HEPN domain